MKVQPEEKIHCFMRVNRRLTEVNVPAHAQGQSHGIRACAIVARATWSTVARFLSQMVACVLLAGNFLFLPS